MTVTTRVRPALRILTALMVVCCPLGSQTFRAGVAWDTSEREGFRQIAVIGKEYLDVQRLRALYESRKRDSDRVFVIYALANSEDATEMLVGVGATDVEFEGWSRVYHGVPYPGKFEMMQLVAVGGDVVIETVDGSEVSRIVVTGKDPMLFEIAGRKCQILEFHWTRPLGELRKGAGAPLNVEVPVRTDILPTESQAEVITREVQRRLNYSNVFVSIRTDTWFVEDSWYPLWFPFAPGQLPPASEKEYRSGGTMSCGMRKTEITCTRWGQ